MFDMNSLNKLKDAIPENVKESVSEAVKQRFGVQPTGSSPEKASETIPTDEQAPAAVAAVPAETDQSDQTSDVAVDDSEQPESEEDKTDAA